MTKIENSYLLSDKDKGKHFFCIEDDTLYQYVGLGLEDNYVETFCLVKNDVAKAIIKATLGAIK